MSTPKRKILITGASGLLGRALAKKFRDSKSWEVIGLSKTRVGNDLVQVDLLDEEALRQTVMTHQPAVIIHSAAERNCNTVDSEYEKSYKLNVDVPKKIAELAAEIGSVVVYISTDYVFDGTSPPYKETSPTNPLNKYGITKLEGEKATLAAHPGSCVLRVPLLFGHVENLQESVVTALLVNLRDTTTKASITDYEIRYPTFVNDVAEACFGLSEKALEDKNVNGIYQFSSRESFTKYEIIKVIAEAFQLSYDHIEADSRPTQGAPRPFDSHMDTSRLDELVEVSHTPFRKAVKDCLGPYMPPDLTELI